MERLFTEIVELVVLSRSNPIQSDPSIPSCRSTNHHDTPPKFGRWILLKIVYVGFCGGSVCSGSIGCNVFCLFGLRYACQLVPSLVTFVASMNLMYVYTRILLWGVVCAIDTPPLAHLRRHFTRVKWSCWREILTPQTFLFM